MPDLQDTPELDLPRSLEQAVAKYKDAGGDDSFYVVSQKDFDRQYKESVSSELKAIIGVELPQGVDKSCGSLLKGKQVLRARSRGWTL